MFCTLCGFEETKVNDSRIIASGSEIRRRRQCLACNHRFTTYEKVELSMPKVVKRSGYYEDFSESKLRSGLLKALEKRPISVTKLDALVNQIITKVQALVEKEMTTDRLGHLVMDELKAIDPVAYVRYASVYLSFDNLNAFSKVIEQFNEAGLNEAGLNE